MELQTLHQENELIKSSSHELLDKENIVHKVLGFNKINYTINYYMYTDTAIY